MRNFVVTGCSRSGTTFTSKAFTEYGWNCGHERVFRPTSTGLDGFGRYQGDASWLAAPFVDQLPDDVVVLHQVREPLDTIRSMASRRFLTPALSPRSLRKAVERIKKLEAPHNRYRRFVLRHTPATFLETSVFARAAKHWVTWNQLVEEQAQSRRWYLRYRVEDLGGDDLLKEISEALDVEPPPQLGHASDTVNSRVRHFDDHDFGKLRPALRDAVKRTAARYGYEL